MIFRQAIIFCVLLVCSLGVNAQHFEKYKVNLSAGTALGLYSNNDFTFTIPLVFMGEYGLRDDIGVGVLVSRYSRRYKLNEDYKYRKTNIALKGALHATNYINDFLDLSIDADKWDATVNLYLGFETNSVRYTGDDSLLPFIDEPDISGRTYAGVTLGLRYSLSEHIGIFTELGRGALGYSTFGVTLEM